MFTVIDNPLWEGKTMSEQPFSAEALREVLSYDPETGFLNWLRPASPRLKVGDRAGSLGGNGRRQISVMGQKCLASYLAWLHYYGEWPTEYVRQRNGNYDDCSIKNLYQQSATETQLAAKAVPGPSGYRGVSFDRRRGKYQATIRRKYRQMHLGYFNTAEEASAAFLQADATFRPDVSPEEMEDKAQQMMIQRRRRALWTLTLRQASDVTGWADDAAFLADVGDPPGARYSLLPIDSGKMIGPGNWKWALPRHAEFDMKTAEGRRAYQAHRRVVNPEPYHATDRRRDFGLTREQDAVLQAQEVCAICGQPETATHKGKVKALAVDHNHAGDKGIRALLCMKCNVGLGNFDDDPTRLRAAATYLERHAREAEERAA